ncbi:hypothetical protein SAMN05421736_101573 [Evansella caseinilytica]|uniref:Uncharacterized protein n=1 Tax=Evansella caseinilytica TaxID=1503961 RepID=A0A1H3HPY8_9BACI|nr:hypothetical protein [Evansella caseinilytica]SDY17480.1 hypothetical protein SAMN05421736_101573 [Evansella caseinilytica]
MSTDTSYQINSDVTTDQDLIELAGLHVYMKLQKDDEIKVNGKPFIVRDSNIDKDKTGLDAITVQNLSSGEYHVVYMGTNVNGVYGNADLLTNVKLLTAPVPEQLEASDQYFLDMEKKYGEISSVAGNSLGGALANIVGVRHSHVRSVTLNPALLPASALNPEADYANITNYISQYDVLNIGIRSGQLAGRVPGNQYDIYNGVPAFGAIGPNHTGYHRPDGADQSYYVIGKEGEPGHGKIYLDAHEHIVTSIWTGQPLYGGNSVPIKINRDMLLHLGSGLETKVLDRLKLAQQYVGHSLEIINDESAKYDLRLTVLRSAFLVLFKDTGNGIMQRIDQRNSRLKETVDFLHGLLDKVEEKGKALNVLLRSTPIEIMEFITRREISVESICEVLRSELNKMERRAEELADTVESIITDKIPQLLHGGQEKMHDFVVGELQSHFQIVQRNKQQAVTQISEYQSQVVDVGESFHKLDRELANQAFFKESLSKSFEITKTTKIDMEDSPHLLLGLKIKEVAVDAAIFAFKELTQPLINIVIDGVDMILKILEDLGSGASITIKAASHVGIYGNPVGSVVSIFTDYDQKIINAVNDMMAPLDEMIDTIHGVRDGLRRVKQNYPTLVDNLRPYIDSALFAKDRFYDVYLYNSAANAILKEMQIVFHDIVRQLSTNRGKAIVALRDTSKSVFNNMATLETQVERGTAW